MSEHQQYIDAYKSWVEEYRPVDFVEYSEQAYYQLKVEKDFHYVWTHHGTCETEQYTSGILQFNSNCGCWQVFGWIITEVPWIGDENTSISVATEWAGPCDICNADGEDQSIDPACPECDGEGYTQDYFD